MCHKKYLLSKSSTFSPWQSAMMDLMDIFAPVSEATPGANRWDSSGASGHAPAPGPLRVDPWDSLGNSVHDYILMKLIKKKKKDIKVLRLWNVLDYYSVPSVFSFKII